MAAGEHVDLPFLSLLPAVASNDYLQNKPKSTNTKTIDFPLLQILAHVLLLQGWWVVLPSVTGSCNLEMGLQKRGALGEKMGVRLRVEEHEREQGEWGLWLEKARGSNSCG